MHITYQGWILFKWNELCNFQEMITTKTSFIQVYGTFKDLLFSNYFVFCENFESTYKPLYFIQNRKEIIVLQLCKIW